MTNVFVTGHPNYPASKYNKLPSGTSVIRFKVNEYKTEKRFVSWDCVAYGIVADNIKDMNLQVKDTLDLRFSLEQEYYKDKSDAEIHRIVLKITDIERKSMGVMEKPKNVSEPEPVVLQLQEVTEQTIPMAAETTKELSFADMSFNATVKEISLEESDPFMSPFFS